MASNWTDSAKVPLVGDPELRSGAVFLQRLRDEAHRFALTTYRAGRSQNIRQSELDEVPGSAQRASGRC